jgi:hypothetical protein
MGSVEFFCGWLHGPVSRFPYVQFVRCGWGLIFYNRRGEFIREWPK